jgi:glyoxylate/hydroxypyruvate reductase A
MTMLLQLDDGPVATWRDALQRELPDEPIAIYPDEVTDPAAIDYAAVWLPPRGMLATLPSLKAIFCTGAGVDHLANDPELPRDVPVVRMVDPWMTARMTEYVVFAVLYHHRRMREYIAQQTTKTWRERPVPLGRDRRVGILGLGQLGTDAARALADLRFDVAGWSTRRKQVDGVTSYAGDNELGAFLARTDILVALLPLTHATEGILNRDTLNRLPAGACVVNAARGGLVVEADLLDLLNSGHIAEATLDVFREEPLPDSHPFWGHPRILITPHVASATPPESAAAVIAANVRAMRAGKAPAPIVDFARGY